MPLDTKRLAGVLRAGMASASLGGASCLCFFLCFLLCNFPRSSFRFCALDLVGGAKLGCGVGREAGGESDGGEGQDVRGEDGGDE